MGTPMRGMLSNSVRLDQSPVAESTLPPDAARGIIEESPQFTPHQSFEESDDYRRYRDDHQRERTGEARPRGDSVGHRGGQSEVAARARRQLGHGAAYRCPARWLLRSSL